MKAPSPPAATPVPAPPGPPGGASAEDPLKLIEDLRNLAVEILGKGIERMFDGADDMLFEMARRATNNQDQRVYFDTMRVVRLGRPKIGRIFREEIARGFDPDTPQDKATQAAELALENLSLQASRSVEETIAIANMASKAEGLYSQLLFELNRRIDWLIKDRHAPVSPNALAPSTISNAFRKSAEALEVEFEIELVVFKLFDRLVISDLGELYTRALRFFEQRGVGASKVAGIPPRPPAAGGTILPSAPAAVDPATVAAAQAAGMVPGANGYGFSNPPAVDPATLNTLRGVGSVGSAVAPTAAGIAYYGDPQLGADLAAAASGQVVPGWEAPRAYAYVQRVGVVGRMFNEILDDPALPVALKPRFDQLRFAVIKSALRDTSFFADRQHPVRGLMNELTTMAAQARASGMDALRRIEDLVGQIQSQFDVAAESIRGQNASPSPVDDQTLDEFFSQQKEEARGRRQAIIEKTRRIVAEELQLQTLSRKIPEGVWPLLNSGWAPLMALRLLKQGPDSPAWKEGLDLLRRILDSADPRRPDARTQSVRDQLSALLEEQLRGIGMLAERISALLQGWQDALTEIETNPLREPVPPPRRPAPPIEEPNVALPLRKPAVRAAATAVETTPVEEVAEVRAEPEEDVKAPDAVTLMDLLMVLSSWFRVYDHDRGQNRWLKVVSHHPDDGTVTFAEFNGQNKLQMRTQVFLDDLVANRAEPIDLGPAARRALEAYLAARRAETEAGSAAA